MIACCVTEKAPEMVACEAMTVAAVAMRFHPLVAAERAVAALANRELGKPAFFLLSFDTRKLRANQRPVDRAFLNIRLRLALLFRHGVIVRLCCVFLIDDGLGRVVERGGRHDRLLLGDDGRFARFGFGLGVGNDVRTLDA